jgi:DNA-binding transcriptional MerR regulator
MPHDTHDAMEPPAGSEATGSEAGELADPGARDGRDADAAPSAAAQHEGEARSPASDQPIIPKEYYAIGEVCDMVGLKPHVLRYWETQFPALNPSKNRSGNRVFQRKEIKLILLVKHLLYTEKYTIEGARQKLEQLRRGGELRGAGQRVLDPELVSVLHRELQELQDLLSPPAQ